MVSKILSKKTEALEKTNVVSSDDESTEPLEEIKPKVKRTQTPAQKAAFEKARLKRAELVAVRKADKDKEQLKYDTYKNQLIKKKELKKVKKQEAELKQYESSSDEEIVYKKKKKTKKIVYLSDDEDEKQPDKPINITINTNNPIPPTKPTARFPVFL